MRKRVVCDTNILVSALIFPGGSPDKAIELARIGEIELFVSPSILDEFKRVLKEKFGYNQGEIKQRIDRITSIATIVNPQEKLSVISQDEADNRIVECATKANADFIVSGDKHLLSLKEFKKIRIVQAVELISIVS